jgi:hypothetical protein
MQGMSRVEEVSIDAPARFIELSTARDRFLAAREIRSLD